MSFTSPTPIDTKFKRETRDCMYHANTDLFTAIPPSTSLGAPSLIYTLPCRLVVILFGTTFFIPSLRCQSPVSHSPSTPPNHALFYTAARLSFASPSSPSSL